MYLSDAGILGAIEKKQIHISDFDIIRLQPVSYDVRIGKEIIVPPSKHYYDIGNPDSWRNERVRIEQLPYFLEPGAFVLGTTLETVSLLNDHDEPFDIYAQVHGKSTLGRLGLLVHVTAGVIDPGFHGTITLELKNVGTNHIVLTPGALIGQLTFAECTRVKNPYNSRYQGQETVTWAR
jgi:dCTP deaminase